MLDACRMRAACIGRGGAGSVTKASSGNIDTVFERAKATADGLVVNEISSDQSVTLAAEAEPNVIDVLRSKGVCRRASELRQASTVAPAVSTAVATTAVPSALAPAQAISPQDVVAAAADAALSAPAVTDVKAQSDDVVQTSATVKPAPSVEPDLLPASSPTRTAAPAPAFTGPGMAFGGEGGPQLQSPPSEQPAKH